jgi:hypothetical protein
MEGQPIPEPKGNREPVVLTTEVQTEDPEALDSQWYDRLLDISRGDIDATDQLAGDKAEREGQKNSFLAGEVRNPTLSTPFIDPASLDSKEQQLLELKKEIVSSEPNELVKQIYRWRINEKVASLRMIRAAHEGNMRSFKRYSEFIHGRPSPEIFQYTVGSVRGRAEQAIEDGGEDLKLAAHDFLAVLPSYGSTPPSRLPTAETVVAARSQTLGELGDILNIEEFEGKLSGESLRLVFERSLDQLGISERQGGDWKVVMDSKTDSKVPSIHQDMTEVRVPEKAAYAHAALVQWVAHEIGTHVLRRRNGERTKLLLLGVGLDRYEGGEEGVATMRQQVVGDESLDDFAGLRYHLAASLALGLDGQPRDFRSTFEVLERYHIFNYMSKGRDREKATKLGRSLAYNDCVRLFRGTDCGPGVVYTKDIAYREANMAVYDLIGSNEGRREMRRFSVGKYDPMNPRHIWVLDQLGITEDDLVELEHD